MSLLIDYLPDAETPRMRLIMEIATTYSKVRYDTDTIRYINVRSKADEMARLV